MRRRLHCLIVFLLCSTLFMDTARACWHRRHRGRVDACQPAMQRPCRPTTCGSWTVTLVDDCSPGAWVVAPPGWHADVTGAGCGGVVIHDGGLSEGMHWTQGVVVVEGMSSTCCVPGDLSAGTILDDHPVVVDHPEMVADGVVVYDGGQPAVAGRAVEQVDAGSVPPAMPPRIAEDAAVIHDPTIVVGTAPAEKTARPAAPQPQVAGREPLPELKPAATAAEQPVAASLDLPADAPLPADADEKPVAASRPAAPMPAVDDLAVDMPVAPVTAREKNLFDELDDEAGEKPADDALPVAPVTRADADEEMHDEKPGDAEPRSPEKPAAAPAETDATSPDAAADAADSAPAAEADSSAMLVPDEPLRRWTDATGEHHAQGWLAEVHTDTVRILKVSGRYTTMAVADLSEADRAYVSATAAGLAAQRRAAATATSTAGL